MWKNLFARGWKGFITRYLSILIILLAINYVVQNSDAWFSSEMQGEESVGMNVEYEVVDQDLHLQFQLMNMELSLEHMDKENKSGQGHVHLYLNGEKVAKIFEPDFVWKGLEPGEYNVRVELAHNNHESYGIEEEFVIRVEEPTDSDVSNKK